VTVTALIVAAGKGERLGSGLPKQFRTLAGKAVLRWAVEPFLRHSAVRDVRVVVGPGQEQLAAQVLNGVDVGPFVTGGTERADSVRAGLQAIATDAVLVHDAARPFCPAGVIDRLVASLEFHDGAAPVLPVGDTLARGADNIDELVDRSNLLRVQTPQAFRTEALRRAYGAWSGEAPTDETTVLRAAGMAVASVAGDPALEKLTTDADWTRAEQWVAGMLVPSTGLGFDVHAFAGEGPIMLGGIVVPHTRGLAGHSDADVVLHSITDAILGAAGLGDIGEHFPPSDPRWKGASSDQFLLHAVKLATAKGGRILNADLTLICERPKIRPHRDAMRARIAELLGLPIERVSVKATTTEGMGFTGREEGLMAQAVVSVETPI